MSEKEVCPVCNKGKLRPEEGDTNVIDMVCDNASCRHKSVKSKVLRRGAHVLTMKEKFRLKLQYFRQKVVDFFDELFSP